jgi:HAD superfamily phosphoserine phosphatase-like hydrolase
LDLSHLLEPPVRERVDAARALGPGTAAVFDADGTVWAGDLGEEVLQALQARGRLPHAPPDAFRRYEALLATDPAAAFAFCVEALREVEVSEVERAAREVFFARLAPRIFPGVRAAIRVLREAGAEVLLVSASAAATLRAVAPEIGLEASAVLAVEGVVDPCGRFTGEVVPPVTCSAGKVEAIRARLGARRPALAFGNSLFDREMLLLAERAVLVAPRGSEGPAVGLAKASGWPIHRVGR